MPGALDRRWIFHPRTRWKTISASKPTPTAGENGWSKRADADPIPFTPRATVATAMPRPTGVAEAMLAALPAAVYPDLHEVIVEYVLKEGFDYAEEFEFGLDLILDAFERVRGAA
jgi:hypothetical protein